MSKKARVTIDIPFDEEDEEHLAESTGEERLELWSTVVDYWVCEGDFDVISAEVYDNES